ncbi:MAG: DUF3795 domain-containing protein [Candidatus Cloacimonetes bacterium]|nr:DUF3795 domain-containing protein [Candidatus Cloacimonadota bacterium]
MKEEMAVCGVICAQDCHAFGTECTGCIALDGKVSWAKLLGKNRCPIVTCAREKGLISCGKCPHVPCDIWMVETKNPSISDEAFAEDIARRLKNLKEAGIL